MSTAPAMVGTSLMSRHWQRYGQIMSDALALTPEYDEEQCASCPYEHRCCSLMVSVSVFEALGIISWLQAHVPDWRGVLGRVKMRAEAMADFFASLGGPDVREAHTRWSEREFMCVFYDRTARNGVGGCSIYPARPIACRKTFGRGPCDDDRYSGVTPMAEDPELRKNRKERLRVNGIMFGEMCSLITLLRSEGAQVVSGPAGQKLLQTDPELLTDAQVLWGLDA